MPHGIVVDVLGAVEELGVALFHEASQVGCDQVQLIGFFGGIGNAGGEAPAAGHIQGLFIHGGIGEVFILAEGVEESYQLEALEKLGVDYIQGYYFSKPVAKDEFVTFIEKNQGAIA